MSVKNRVVDTYKAWPTTENSLWQWRAAWMKPEPPRDFVKHLPYSAPDSGRLDNRVQAYGFWTNADGKPMQVGVSPDLVR